jgi:hypothetical protein
MYLDEYFDHIDDIVLDVHNKVINYYFHKLDLYLVLILEEYLLTVDDHELHNLHLDMYIIGNLFVLIKMWNLLMMMTNQIRLNLEENNFQQ